MNKQIDLVLRSTVFFSPLDLNFESEGVCFRAKLIPVISVTSSGVVILLE